MSKKQPKINKVRYYARKIAERHPSDRYLYSRILAHFKAGILDLKDLKEGTFQ